MSTVVKAYNMRDTEPAPARARYRLHVYRIIEDTATGYTAEEGSHEEFADLRDALHRAAEVVRCYGGPDAWDDLDGRVQSCWLDYSEYTFARDVESGQAMVSVTMWLEKVTDVDIWTQYGGVWRYRGRQLTERELRLSLRRLRPFA